MNEKGLVNNSIEITISLNNYKLKIKVNKKNYLLIIKNH